MRTVTLPLPADLDARAVVIHADGTATVYEAGDALPEGLVAVQDAAPRRLEPYAFRDRFTAAEQAAFAALAYSGDTTAQLLLLKLSTATNGVDLDSPEVAAGLDYLVSKGVITAARRAEVLA